MRSPINYFGGKGRLQSWIRSYFPPHTRYLEPFGGAGAVILNKLPSDDCYNEINGQIYDLMFNLQDPRFFKAFMDVINPMRYDESHFKYYKNLKISSLVESGIKTYVTYRMSRGGIGKDFSSAFNRTRGGRPEKINSWETMKEELPLIHMRLQDIHISNKDALNLIADSKFNQSNVLQYLDPPYLPDTRVTKSVYRHEFTEQNHIDLAKICNQSKAKIIISGYPSKLYNKLYHGWNVVVKECKNNSGQNKIKNMRKEILWMNF